MSRRGLPPGIRRKHSRSCPAHADKAARCSGKCPYQVQAGPRANRTTKTFASLDAAKAWKNDYERARAHGRIAEERAPTLRQAAERWRADAEAGVALARGNKPFRAGTLNAYWLTLEGKLLDELGGLPLDRITQTRLNELAASLSRAGDAPSTVRNTLMPLRAIFRHAERMGWTATNPTRGMVVPAGSGRRTRVVPAAEIPRYLEALPALGDRALWATAFYVGLRRGELRALRWSSVDLAAGTIAVDGEAGNFDSFTRTMQAPKSVAGRRTPAMPGVLRDVLAEFRAATDGRGLVFARGALHAPCRAGMERHPFDPTSIANSARKAWLAAGLAPVTLHECRHTFASLSIAAMSARGVFNPKVLQTVMGHSSIQVTYDRYGHLFPGQEAELAGMLDDLIAQAVGADARDDTCATVGHTDIRRAAALGSDHPATVQRTSHGKVNP